MTDIINTNSALEPVNNSIPDDVLAELQRHNLDIKIGDEFIDTSRNWQRLIVVTGFEWVTEYQKQVLKIKVNHKNDPDRIAFCDLKYFVQRDDGRAEYHKLYASFEQVQADALAVLANPSLLEEDDEQTEASSTSIMVASGSTVVKAAERIMNEKHSRMVVLKATIEMMMRGINNRIDKISEELKYTRAVLRILETYMGVYEEIICIHDGEPASITEPVYIHQLVQYCDEVSAVLSTANGQIGIDYTRLPDFDAWLLEDNHWKTVIPEQKGIIAFKPSRQDRRYTDNFFANLMINGNNKMVYLLIRNGEQLHRVWTNMSFGDRLFPTNTEWEQLMNDLENETFRHMENKHKELSWQQQAVLIEGLINRTTVLNPLPENISLLKPESFENNWIVMIRDAEPSLTDGRPTYNQWKKDLNSKITKGTRILYQREFIEQKYLANYFVKYYRNYPRLPGTGVYVAEEVFERTHSDKIKFLYLPSDQIYVYSRYGVDLVERKNRVAFLIYKDEFNVLNYDDLRYEDLDYYLNNSLERRHFIEIMPLLLTIRSEMYNERQLEKPFVDLIVNELDCSEQEVWDAIHWWKTKTKHHRWLSDDDAKAWRMIRKEIKRKKQGIDTIEEADVQ